MLSLPLITPRDSHELWFGSPQPHRTQTQPANDTNQPQPRRNAHHHPHSALNTRAIIASTTPSTSLSALHLEERALRARKQNIASFGYSWIKPAGCPKTMLGMKEEEAEREEAMAAAAAEMSAATAAAGADPERIHEFGSPRGGDGQDDSAMERDLDDDVPDADAEDDVDAEAEAEVEGLVEEGEEALEEEDVVVDEEGYMERDLDDDIPEGFDDVQGDEGDLDDFDNQPDLDDDVPLADDGGVSEEGMVHDLDEDIPEAVEAGSGQEEEWQHTDTEAELDDDDDGGDSLHDPFAAELRTSTSSGRGPPLPPIRREIETEAQRRFLQRWSGGGDALDSSGMMADDDDLGASIASHSSRRSGFGRLSRTSRPRDSFN